MLNTSFNIIEYKIHPKIGEWDPPNGESDVKK